MPYVKNKDFRGCIFLYNLHYFAPKLLYSRSCTGALYLVLYVTAVTYYSCDRLSRSSHYIITHSPCPNYVAMLVFVFDFFFLCYCTVSLLLYVAMLLYCFPATVCCHTCICLTFFFSYTVSNNCVTPLLGRFR